MEVTRVTDENFRFTLEVEGEVSGRKAKHTRGTLSGLLFF